MTNNITFVCLYGGKFGGMERRYIRLAEYLKRERNLKIKMITFEEAIPAFQEIGVNPKIFDLILFKKRSFFLNEWNFVQRMYWLYVKIRIFLHVYLNNSENVFFAHNPQGLHSTLMLHYPMMLKLFSKFGKSISVAAVSSIFEEYKDDSIQVLDLIHSVDALSLNIANFLSAKNEYASIKIAPCSFIDYTSVEKSSQRSIDIIMVARFNKHKGYDLLESLSEYLSCKNIRIIGFGENKPKIPGAYYESSKNVMKLLSQSKIFLSLQRFNNYPSQSLLEAMASECAIIATDVGETRLILDDTNSLLINYNAEELKAAIDKLLTNPDLRTELGKNAREKAINEHRIERYADYFTQEIIGIHS